MTNIQARDMDELKRQIEVHQFRGHDGEYCPMCRMFLIKLKELQEAKDWKIVGKEEEPKGHTTDIMKRMEIRNILETLVHRGSSPYSDVKDLIERTTDELLKALKSYEE